MNGARSNDSRGQQLSPDPLETHSISRFSARRGPLPQPKAQQMLDLFTRTQSSLGAWNRDTKHPKGFSFWRMTAGRFTSALLVHSGDRCGRSLSGKDNFFTYNPHASSELIDKMATLRNHAHNIKSPVGSPIQAASRPRNPPQAPFDPAGAEITVG